LSVFFLGMVQVSEIEVSVREAARSVTGSGNLREGGKGAPGVPQPTMANPIASAAGSAARLSFCAVLIAIPVYWSEAVYTSRRKAAMRVLTAQSASAVKLKGPEYTDKSACVAVPAAHGILQEQQPDKVRHSQFRCAEIGRIADVAFQSQAPAKKETEGRSGKR
jgi:hypothetical protein